MPSLVELLDQKLLAHGVPLLDSIANIDYSDGVNATLFEERGIAPWIPASSMTLPIASPVWLVKFGYLSALT